MYVPTNVSIVVVIAAFVTCTVYICEQKKPHSGSAQMLALSDGEQREHVDNTRFTVCPSNTSIDLLLTTHPSSVVCFKEI